MKYLLIVILIILSALFSASEISYASASTMKQMAKNNNGVIFNSKSSLPSFPEFP